MERDKKDVQVIVTCKELDTKICGIQINQSAILHCNIKNSYRGNEQKYIKSQGTRTASNE